MTCGAAGEALTRMHVMALRSMAQPPQGMQRELAPPWAFLWALLWAQLWALLWALLWLPSTMNPMGEGMTSCGACGDFIHVPPGTHRCACERDCSDDLTTLSSEGDPHSHISPTPPPLHSHNTPTSLPHHSHIITTSLPLHSHITLPRSLPHHSQSRGHSFSPDYSTLARLFPSHQN